MNPSPRRVCPDCGNAIPEHSAVEECAYCLIGLTLERPSPEGIVFGSYKLLDRIGQGGEGIVYKARHDRLRRIVALKVMQTQHLASESEKRRFEREAEAIAQLEHPQIVTLYEFGEFDGRTFLAMEFMEGGDLNRLKTARFSAGATNRNAQRDVAELAKQIAGVAHHAHQRGFIHRDIKPGNLLLDAEGVPHLSDFGLVKWDSEETITRTHEGLGTPAYMSPEQALGQSKQATVRSDVYSIGAVLYELLTGQPPFVENSALAILQKVIQENPQPPTKVNPSLPRDLEIICLKALEKDPKRRYASAEDLALELGRWLEGDPITARPVRWWERVGKWVKRNPLISLLSVACALFLLIGITGTAWQWRKAALGATETNAAHYTTAVAASIASSKEGRFDTAVELLRPFIPPPGNTDLRGFEWRLARRLSLGEPELRRRFEISPTEGRAFLVAQGGSWCVVPGTNQSLEVRSLTTGRITDRLPSQETSALQISESNDGRWIAAGGYDGWRVWQREGFREVMHGTNVAFSSPGFLSRALVQFLDDGSLLVCENNKVVRCRPEAETKAIVLDLKAGDPTAVAASPDGQWIAVGSSTVNSNRAYQVELWKPGQTAPERRLLNYSGPVTALEFSGDSQWLAFSGFVGERSPTVWNLKTGQELRQIAQQNEDNVLTVALSPDSKQLAVGCIGGEIKLFSLPEGQLTRTYRGIEGTVRSIAFSKDGSQLYARSDSRVRHWDLRIAPVIQLQAHHIRGFFYGSDLIQIQFTDDSRRLRSAGIEYGVREFSTSTLLKEREYPVLRYPGSSSLLDGLGLPFAMGKDRAASFDATGVLKIYRLQDTQTIFSLSGLKGTVIAASFSQDESLLASGDLEGRIHLWNLRQGAAFRALGRIKEQYPTKLIFTDSNRRLVCTSTAVTGTGKLSVWDLDTGSLTTPLSQEPLINGALSPSGQELAVAGDSGAVMILNTQTWKLIRRFQAHAGTLTALAWSPDGRTLATGGVDKSINLWRSSSWAIITSLHHCSRPVADLAFSRDGRYLAAATISHRVYLWLAPTDQELEELEQARFGQ